MAPADESAKRAAGALTIAQLKFKQALKKDDTDQSLPAISLQQSAEYIKDIDAVLKQDTPANIQKCTGWIMANIAPAKERIAALGDYLVAVAKSLLVDQEVKVLARKAARSRMHLLMIISDALHADTYHQPNPERRGRLAAEGASFITQLVELATSCISGGDTRTEKKLRALLNLWSSTGLLNTDDMRTLQDRVDGALNTERGGASGKEKAYLLPEYHGDRRAPWHTLPAAYMLGPMSRRPDRPTHSSYIKIARLNSKSVSGNVRDLLDNYFEKLDIKHAPTGDSSTSETSKHKLHLDPLGQLIKQCKDTGEKKIMYTAYGWSQELCQDMQKDGVPASVKLARADAKQEEEHNIDRPSARNRSTRSPGYGRRSSTESSYTRERDGYHGGRRNSGSSYYSRDSRSRSRSYSPDRSRSRHGHSPRPTHSRASGYNDSRRNQEYDRNYRPRSSGNDQSKSTSRWNKQGAPSQNAATGHDPNSYASAPRYRPGKPEASQNPFPGTSTHPNQFPGQFPGPFPMQGVSAPPLFQPGLFAGGIPPPPPPPPGYSGVVPPPPPAVPNQPHNFGANQAGHSYGNNFGFGTNQGYQQGRGNYRGGSNGNRGNFQGRGGYNNRGGNNYSQRGQRGGHW